ADGVVFEAFPVDEENVPCAVFEAAPQFVAAVAIHGRDDGRGFGEGGFEGTGFTGPHIEDGDFEDHGVGLVYGVVTAVSKAAMRAVRSLTTSGCAPATL